MLSFLYGPTLTAIRDHRKTIASTIWIFVGKVISLLFNTLPRSVTASLPRSKRLFNFIAAVTIPSDSGAQENKICHFSPCFPISDKHSEEC